MVYLLPTEDGLTTTIGILHQMQNKDYDLDELISEILTGLRHSSLYPASKREILRYVTPVKVTIDGDPYANDNAIYNQAAGYLYEVMFTALMGCALYNEKDDMTCPYFNMRGNAIVVSDEPIMSPPGGF